MQAAEIAEAFGVTLKMASFRFATTGVMKQLVRGGAGP
jgi:hypothetical protein